jgi:hypothetical protein
VIEVIDGIANEKASGLGGLCNEHLKTKKYSYWTMDRITSI